MIDATSHIQRTIRRLEIQSLELNAVRFDVGTHSNYLFYSATLREFTQTLTKPRVMQFGLRYSF